MNTFIDIISNEIVTDAEGFSTCRETVTASVRAYKENRHGSEKWANRAVFSEATSLFRFRIIPGVVVDTSKVIVCDGERYDIVSVDDVRQRGMYIEIMARKVEMAGG